MTDLSQRRISALMRDPGRAWFRFENKAADVATIYLYDEIGYFGVTSADFVRELAGVTAKTIALHVNSPGGDVFDGIAILNALRQHPARVVATVDGLAASAASFIVAGADEVVMAKNSEFMIHDAWGGAVGPADEMRKMADELDHFSDNIASIYADRAGGTPADWRKVMRSEAWYSAEETVAAGLADRVDEGTDGSESKARIDRSIFNYAGRAAAPAPLIPAQMRRSDPAPRQGGTDVQDKTLMALRQRLGVAADTDEDAILAALDEVLEEVAEPPASVQADLAELAQFRAERRTSAVEAAVRANKITPGERPAWQARMEVAPDATMAALAQLPSGRIPTEPIGHEQDVEEGVALEDRLFERLFTELNGGRS